MIIIKKCSFLSLQTRSPKPRPLSAAQRKIQELNQQLEQMNLANLELQGELAVNERDGEKEREEHGADIERVRAIILTTVDSL